VRNYRWHPDRKWELDFAWPELMIAVEIEGSGHRRVTTFRKDTEKYNMAVALGWRVIRFQGCDYKPSKSRPVYPRGAADWYETTIALICNAR
jgi:very-short-patch-repair endonuclease